MASINDMSEVYKELPRVNSTHSRIIYDEMVEISRHINFNHPMFAHRMKRSLSVSSVQAFIVELALTNDNFRNYLREFMVSEGRGWITFSSGRFPKYSSPIDEKKAQERFSNQVDSRDMFIDRDMRKLIDPPSTSPGSTKKRRT
jgi:hypothetical protein